MNLIKTGKILYLTAILSAMLFLTVGCSLSPGQADGSSKEGEIQMFQNSRKNKKGQDPYAVRSFLREEAAVDPKTGEGVYGRYTELIPDADAPETFKNAIRESNRRAEEAVTSRLKAVPSVGSGAEDYRFETYAYIVTVTRADRTAFSILETEYTESAWDDWKGSELSVHFKGTTCDTETGEEIPLSDLVGDEASCTEMLKSALKTAYGTDEIAKTDPEDYGWTADALGIRFYFHSDAVSRDVRQALNDYSDAAVSAALPYDRLTGEKAENLAEVPDDYIARIETETLYDLPHGDLSVMLTEQDGETVIRMIPDKGNESSLTIEYADRQSDYYIIRSLGGFYLFRERSGYQEGFFYDFSRPDGGFGRFAYNTCQYFDSFLSKLELALPYDPSCAHMAEVKRSFGESSYDKSSFVPNGDYAFPDAADSRYKRFVLIDDALEIDTRNTACRLLEDMKVTKLDGEGNEAGEMTVNAGETMVLETVRGEADRYEIPTKRGRQEIAVVYDARLSDGTKVRFTSDSDSVISVDKRYLNRFTEPVSLAEAGVTVTPEAPEVFTVRIGGKDYPVIPDYSKRDHYGEEIDFGDDVWWQAEGYVGRFEMTKKDRQEMEETGFYFGPLNTEEGNVTLEIQKDGQVVFDYYGKIYEGTMPEKRFYGEHATVSMKAEDEYRAFSIILRDGELHDAPNRIEFFSEGLPATNEPSKVPPLSVYMSRK